MKYSFFVLLFSGSLLSCSKNTVPNFEPVQDMMESPAIKAQEFDETSPNQSGMRLPPENTVPQGFTPYKYGMDVERAGKENKNPLAGQDSEEVLKVGEKYFETQCMACHGQAGEGGETNNSIGEKMARKPPSLLSPRVRDMTDGHLYHIITKGQGVMGPYESHVPQSYRWQVVNYIRNLQKNSAVK